MPGIPSITPYPLPTREHLPANHARWAIDPRRAVLLVHDMQRFFLAPFSEPLRTDLVRNVAVTRRRCMDLGVPIAYTAQPGSMSSEQRGLLREFWGPGMRAEPGDRDVVTELAPCAGDWMLTKWRYSAFFRSDLLERMRASRRDQLILCGVYAHVGVLATALDAFTHDVQPFLIADALGDFSESDHRLTLDYVARCCGVVALTGEILI